MWEAPQVPNPLSSVALLYPKMLSVRYDQVGSMLGDGVRATHMALDHGIGVRLPVPQPSVQGFGNELRKA